MRTFVSITLPKLAGFGPRFGLGLGLLCLTAGCTDTPKWGGWSSHPSAVQIAAVMGRLDSYVYYPAYGIYFNRTKQQYVFPSGGVWVTRNEPPREVVEGDLFASPAVAMNFSDAPERHHAAVLRAYPRYWGQPGTVTASAH